MSQRTFNFRLRSSHRPPERSTSDLVVEFLGDAGLWEPQQLSLTMPGFRIYLISLLLCQHFYLVANAREKAIPLLEVQADFSVSTSSDWIIASVEGDFRIRLDHDASASGEAIAYMQERMKLCPISRNLPEHVNKSISLHAFNTSTADPQQWPREPRMAARFPGPEQIVPDTQTQPVEHCPRFPEHCSLECMERMRAEFGFYTLNEPPFEDWCPFARAARLEDEARKAKEEELRRALHHREFPDDPLD